MWLVNGRCDTAAVALFWSLWGVWGWWLCRSTLLDAPSCPRARGISFLALLLSPSVTVLRNTRTGRSCRALHGSWSLSLKSHCSSVSLHHLLWALSLLLTGQRGQQEEEAARLEPCCHHRGSCSHLLPNRQGSYSTHPSSPQVRSTNTTPSLSTSLWSWQIYWQQKAQHTANSKNCNNYN